MSAKIAVVTGASRGIGRGVAIALSEAGYRVVATGRSVASADLPAAVQRVACDHRDDAATERVFAETGAPDILVNCAWGGYERMSEDGKFTWMLPFWEQPLHRWKSMVDGGLRTIFTCSAAAGRRMVPRGRGLIVNLSVGNARYLGNAIYGAVKAATDKLTADMAHELKPHGIAAIALYPGLVRTEAVLAAAKQGAFSLDNSESPQFIGRVIAALADDPNLISLSGQALVAAVAARERGVLDIDGKSPEPTG
jgi:NAD(P)-dependent dehydrogenase (short-subunit alcohol dehydrogenase family)